jgi:hypothetical protein
MRIVQVLHDSGGMQFWGSELYRRGLPLVDPESGRMRRSEEEFGRKRKLAYRAQARRLNAAGQGDQACFYLVRA